MTRLTISDLDPAVEERLRLRAMQHGHSMEEEIRQILSMVCETEQNPESAYSVLRKPFAEIGGVELDIPPRSPVREPPSFD